MFCQYLQLISIGLLIDSTVTQGTSGYIHLGKDAVIKSLMNKMNKRVPRIEPWGKPMSTDLVTDENPLTSTY